MSAAESSRPPRDESRDSRHAGGVRLPQRSDLRDNVELLKRGGNTKADLLLLDLGNGPMVVKDFARKSWWVRQIGRWQISRESRAYLWLGPTPGIPRFIGRIDRHALAIQKIDGQPLGYAADRADRGLPAYRQLQEIVEAMHASGMVHWDLRARENVLVDSRDRVYVLDLASAVRLRPGGLAHRLLFRRMKLIDVSALLKWKRVLEAGDYTPEEETFVRRYRRWRSLWIFNPRGSKRWWR